MNLIVRRCLANAILANAILANAILASLLLTGCESKAPSSRGGARPAQFDDVAVSQQDDFAMGTELLHRIAEPNPGEVDRLALYHLNQWLAREGQQAEDWKPAQLTQRIPKSLAAIQPMQELDRLRLTRDDLNFLRGRIWQRDLIHWLEKRPLEPLIAEQVQQTAKGLDEAKAKQLATVVQAFDWTVRNIQLDPFATPEDAKPLGASSDTDDSGALPPQRGLPGPGYQRYPYETMLYGHGDAYERDRVFIELCRQAGVEAFMVAVRPDMGPLKPWAIGVMLDAEIYLFDAELGLALPGDAGQGIATLAQVVKEPTLLEQLNVNDKRPYWVKAGDLETLEVVLSASPEEVSKRMSLLDEKLTGPRHLELYVDADALAERIRKTPPLAGAIVSLWRVPFECYLYSIGRGLRLSRDRDFAIQYERETRMLRGPTMVQIARQLQFQGQFDSADDTQGATMLLMDARPPERAIEDLLYSQDLQQAAGLAGQLSSKPEERRQQIETFASFIQRMRDDVTYWIGLIQYEKRDYETALDWLKTRTLEASDENPWQNGARYNSARSYEALGQYDEAIKLYRQSESPQRDGDLLRAKWLESRKK
jgi:tetratricopeptide (TPR) repeat protein